MNKPMMTLCAALLVSSCGVGTKDVTFDVADIEDYLDWKDDQTKVEIEPFKAEPILVSGTGTVRAAPDIAVLTGFIKTEGKVDYKAMDSAAQIINKVQEIIEGKDINISFTSLAANEKRDEKCLAHNQIAATRHADINSDNWFNKNQLNRRKDVRQKLREPKDRIAEKVCEVTHVENYIGFTAWIRPSGDVSDYIRSFTEAGVEQVNLFGFDFSNYDALYKEAAEKAVANAREKAEISARIAGTKLTTVERFSVTRTERTSRYGQQAMLISPHGNRSVTPKQRTSFSDRVIRSQATPRNNARRAYNVSPAPPSPSPVVANVSCWDGSIVFSINHCPAMAIESPVQGSQTDFISDEGIERIQPVFETITETIVVQEAASELVRNGDHYVERVIPAVTKQETRRVVKTPASARGHGVKIRSGGSNSLRESMLSGSKTIRVSATLAYNYETPLDGVIFKVPETK